MAWSRRHKILVIDSISYTRMLLNYTLAAAGYKVAVAQNSAEATEDISSELPDLILLSIRDGDPESTVALRTLKDYFKLRMDIALEAEPPIIVLGAFRDSTLAHEVQFLGVQSILAKPINIHELLDAVKSAIANRKKVVSHERKKIVILDSEARSQQFLKSILMCEVYDIRSAASGMELIGMLREEPVDLCIIDVPSVEGDFADLVQGVREISDDIMVIALIDSRDDYPKDNLETMDLQAYFTKPINIDEFRGKVDELMDAQPEDELSEESPEGVSEPASEQARVTE